LVDVDIFRERGHRGLKKIGSGRVAVAFIRRPGALSAAGDLFSPGSRLVPGAEC
jgi:hypothetical protein